MNRRSFVYRFIKLIISTGIAAIPFGLGQLLSTKKQPLPTDKRTPITHDKLRPPGALFPDNAFVRACIHCNLCADICPPQCIEYYLKDGINTNTPYIDPSRKACTLCGKCMEVCPTNALTVTDIKSVTMGLARIERSTCYPWVDGGICGACVSICPIGEKAIDFEFANIYRPVVNEGCVGCGLCVEVCPHPSLAIRVVKQV